MLSLHEGAWNQWLNSESTISGPAVVTEAHLSLAVQLIAEDAATIDFAEASDLYQRWEDMVQDIASANGYDIVHDDALALIVYHPYEHRFAIAPQPKFPPFPIKP